MFEHRREESLELFQRLVVQLTPAIHEHKLGTIIRTLHVEHIVARHEFDAAEFAHRQTTRRMR